MNRTFACLAAVVACGIAGLMFGPVFTVAALIVPVAAVCGAVVVADLLTVTRPRLAEFRAPLALMLGLAAVVETALRETTSRGVPTTETWHALSRGVSDGWLRSLDGTWPVRPDPDLVVFVPLLVVASAMLGVECLRRDRSPLVALLPSLIVAGTSQTFHALTGSAVVLTGAAYAGVAVVVLAAAGRTTQAMSRRRDRRPNRGLGVAAVITVAGLAIGVVGFLVVDPSGRPAYSLREHHRPPTIVSSVANPLDDIGGRLSTPDLVAFRNHPDAPVDRWTVAVLDRFDGVNWTNAARFQPLGVELPGSPDITAPSREHRGTIELVSTPGAWLPTQTRTVGVDGTAPLVDAESGMLLSTAPTPGLRFDLRWRSPEVGQGTLTGAALGASSSMSLGAIPPELSKLAQQATANLVPSVQTALVLEAWFRANYQVASGKDLPTGHGYAQLQYFLNNSKRGTSEQFATAYTVLARAVGIPARVVVGFRQPAEQAPDGQHVVHNRDVLAWPEIAVRGLGWLPLDPTGTATSAARPDKGSVAEAVAGARDSLPPPEQIEQQITAPAGPSIVDPPPPDPWPWWSIIITVSVIVGLGLATIMLAKRLRRMRRRRATPTAAVIGAWLDARDRLRDHGMSVRRSMTARDVAAALPGHIDGSAARELRMMTWYVDAALWSGVPATPHMVESAWAAADGIRRALAKRPMVKRLRATLAVRGLSRMPA